VEILEGYRTASGGEASVLGIPVGGSTTASRELRERVGIVLQESAAEPGLKVRECLELYAGYYRAPRGVADTLDLVGLAGEADHVATTLSGGQRRRLDVAMALIGDPELIFLDEPTTGFDPGARRTAWDTVRGLRELGKTVFLTTHYMEEAERLADRIAVIAAGEIVAEGTPQTLAGRQLQALAHGQAGLGLGFLQDDPDPRPPARRRAPRIVAEHLDLARAGLAKALQDFDRRRLAGPVGAEEGEDLAAPDLQVDPADRLVVVVALAQPADRDDRVRHCIHGVAHRRGAPALISHAIGITSTSRIPAPQAAATA